jgi:hypothetical protein
VITDKHHAFKGDTLPEEIGIPAADQYQSKHAFGQLCQQRQGFAVRPGPLGVRNDRRQRAVEVQAEKDPRGRYVGEPLR